MKQIIFLLFLLPVVMTGQVVGYYPLNGNADDYSGYETDGIATNVTYVAGKQGQSGYFNGSSSKIELLLTNSFPVGANARTINAWILQNTYTGQNYYVIFDYGEPAGANGFMFHNMLNTSRTYQRPRLYTGSFSRAFATSPPHDTLRWHMITVVVPANSDSVNDILLYRDGTETLSYSTSNGLLNTTQTSSVPKIGVRSNGTYYFKGMIDEVLIDSRAWSGAEIKNKYAYYQGFFSN